MTATRNRGAPTILWIWRDSKKPTTPKSRPWPARSPKNRSLTHEPGTLRHPPLRPAEHGRLQPRAVSAGTSAVGLRREQPGQERVDQRAAIPDSGAHVRYELR